MLPRMANPYTQPYEQFRGMGNVKGASAQERRQREQASGTADLIRMLGSVAPAVGTVAGTGLGALIGAAAGGVGAAPGAAIGGALGGGLGQVAGGLANEGASSMEKPFLERQAARDRQIEMLLSTLGSMR